MIQARASLETVMTSVSRLTGTNGEVVRALTDLVVGEAAWLSLLDREEIISRSLEVLREAGCKASRPLVSGAVQTAFKLSQKRTAVEELYLEAQQGDLLPQIDPQIWTNEGRYKRFLDSLYRLSLYRRARPESVLGCFAVHSLCLIPPHTRVETDGSENALNALSAVVGQTGKGKGNVQGCTDVVLKPLIQQSVPGKNERGGIRRAAGVASGEAIIDQFSGSWEDDDDIMAADEDGRVSGQKWDAVLLVIDEMKSLLATMDRSGSTTDSTLTSLLTGGDVTSQKADVTGNGGGRVTLTGGEYRFCGSGGLQPEFLDRLAKTGGIGLVKRILKLPAGMHPDQIHARKVLVEGGYGRSEAEEDAALLRSSLHGLRENGTVTVARSIQEVIDKIADASVEDRGFSEVDPAGQGLHLRIVLAAFFARLSSLWEIDRDAWTMSGYLMSLDEAMHRHILGYVGEVEQDERAREIGEYTSKTVSVKTKETWESTGSTPVLDRAMGKILEFMYNAGGEHTATDVRDKSGANSSTQAAHKGVTGKQLHVHALERMVMSGAVKKVGRKFVATRKTL
jgi:hypothetical protein